MNKISTEMSEEIQVKSNEILREDLLEKSRKDFRIISDLNGKSSGKKNLGVITEEILKKFKEKV